MEERKAVYLIGAGPLAIRSFAWAKELGLLTVVTDQNPNAPGRAKADFFEQISAGDQSGRHEAFVDNLPPDVKVCGVYCGNEIGAPTANRLRRHLNLSFADPQSMTVAADKYLMKRMWAAKKISTPQSQIVESPAHLEELLKGQSQAFVIKPSLGSGSRGVQVVYCGDNPQTIWENALNPVDYRGSVLLEPYIIGRSIDVNGIFFNDEYHPAGTLEKYISDVPECLPLGGYDPADVPMPVAEGAHRLMEAACRALNLTEGPVKGDMILAEDGELYILEVAPRLHGDVTTCNTLPFGSGCNALKFLFKCWADGEANVDLLHGKGSGYAAWRVLCLPPGRDYYHQNSNIIEGDGNVTVAWFNHRHKPPLSRYVNTTQIPGYVCAYGQDKSDAEEHLSRFCEGIQGAGNSDGGNPWYQKLGETLNRLRLSGTGYRG